ncbi:MAG: excinuclease ABC subunit UvrC [Clostridiales bacterium]|nr:excinuclease ABC subunit UvrC [Candidatus Cacconaster stercorequi]
MTRDELRQKANDLPLAPGVYLMMDKTGRVIYVGKAKKLKNRVSQYFQSGSGHNEKTRAMVSQVDHFDTIFVSSEFEALILENSLIKRHQPRYNILLKDDKGYPFVRLDTGVSYPRFTLVSKAADDGAKYFGPFGGRHETRLAIDAVCGALKLPTCSRRFPRDIGKERPCLNHHIGRCDGFCRPDGPDQVEYRQRIDQAVRIFSGKYRQLTGELQQQMENAAEALEFEKAAALRDRIRAISMLGKQQQVIAGVCADTDVWGVYPGQVRCGCAVLHIESGNLLGREVEVFPSSAADTAHEGQILSAVLSQYYLDKLVLPAEILLPVDWEDMDTFAALLSERCGHKVTLRIPQRGEKADLLRMARRNAREEVERITSDAERISKTLCELGKLAGLEAPPRRLESYDISNTGRDDMVASMVVFVDGKPLKRDYRRFQIKTLSAPDDYAAMQEVLSRRFRRYLDGDEKFAQKPDLLLIDGGETHARAVRQALAELGIFDIPILGMVKDDRHRTRALMTPEGQELGIQQSPPLFALIGRIQEEVHRFAITYHHEKHTRSAYASRLDGIPGIGEVRKAALLKHFGSIKAIRQASVEELSAVVPKSAALAVYDHFHKEETT